MGRARIGCRDVRVVIDATPLLGRRTGVGRYVGGLIDGLVTLPDAPDIALTAFTIRGRGGQRAGGLPIGGRRFSARLLQSMWGRLEFPPAEFFAGVSDVFHATNYVLPPVRRAAGVVSVHDLSYELFPETVSAASLRYRLLVPRSLRRARLVLALTHAAAAEIAAFYKLDPSGVRAARPGLDPSWLETSPPTSEWLRAHGLPERYVLFVGTLEPRKNLPVLLAAMRALRATDPSMPPLVLVGAQGWGEMLESAPDVVTPGFLEDDVLRQVVAGAACLAFPSRHEGFGIPPLEALACGVPVVSSDLPALREVTGEHASYVAVDDVDSLADAIGRSVAGDGGASARAARRAHAAQWTWERCAREALSAYREAAQAN